MIFDALDKIKAELAEHFPYIVIDVHRAEADDVIGTLATQAPSNWMGLPETTLIISSDKDFQQLSMPGVDQWSPILNKRVFPKDSAAFLKEHIIRGDKGDGIPNVLSDSNTFVDGRRQKVMTNALFERLMSTHPSLYDDRTRENYERNRQLIDLSMIPEDIRAAILTKFSEGPVGEKRKVFPYLMSKGLRKLVENAADF